jgi:O-Antigen ligase
MVEIVSWWWDSKPGRWLNSIALIAAVLVLLRVAMEEDLTWIGGVIIVAILALVSALRWPTGAILVLIAMSAMPVYFIELFGWKARPEHFAAGIVLAAVLIAFFMFKQRPAVDKLDYWILAYVAVNFISSAFGSPQPSTTLRWALQNSLAVLPYFLIRFMVQDIEMCRKAFRILLGVGLVEAVYGIGCYASHQLFGTSVGVTVGQYLVDIAAPYGSMYEANLFGSYTACCAVMCLACYLFGGRHLRYLICFFIASLAGVLSFSRAALAALIIIIGWVLWKARRANRFDLQKLVVFAMVVALIVTFTITIAGDVIVKRFTNLWYEGLTEETAMVRFLVYQEALTDIPGHWLIGNGTASFNLTFDWNTYFPEWSGEKTWIGNTPLRVVHDTGLIGLITLLGFCVAVWRKVRKVSNGRGISDPMLLGLVAGVLLYGISFESTDGSILAYFWLHLGLLASAAILLTPPGQTNGVQDAGLVSARTD